MIFKQINNSVDETRKTIALFNKDWNTYKRNWQNANGVFGKIGSVFIPANAISKSDIEAIKAYNFQIDSCVTSQTAFNRTMLNASPAAQNLVASYNGGKVSAQDMATAQNTAETSTIGLTIAQTALNAAIGMGIGLLISLAVKLVHVNEEAIEKAEELRRKYEEFKSTNENNITTLNGLKKEFEELSKGVSQYGDNVSLTTEQYERYREIIQQIVGMSPSLAEGYSTENGYIADKNGLLERAIKLQELEYRNELRKITNLENLKTSMSGYIAEYKKALNGGFITSKGNIVGTTIDTDFNNALWQLFNTNNRDDFSGEDMARQIIESLGVKDVDMELEKYFNKYGNWQDNWFWDDYCDKIVENLNAVTTSISAEEVGLDDTLFDQNLEKLESCAEKYSDMKDSVQMANASIQTDLNYIAEYADGYSNLSTEQQKFVSDFLKGFNISDIASENLFGFLEYDNDKMASVKNQIKKFVEELSHDDITKNALANLYAIPTDEQSISEFVEQFRNALEVIQAYCKENGIKIPIAISDSEQTVNDLEAQYQRAVDFAEDKFDGYDPTAFFKEHSINTQEEIDAWQEIAQRARDAAEAEKEYVQTSTLNDKTPISSFEDAWANSFTSENEAVKKLGNSLLDLAEKGRLTIDTFNATDSTDYFKNLGISAEEAIVKINRLVDESSQLSSMSDRFSKISDALGTKRDDGFVSADTLSGFDAEVRGLDSWDRFQEVLGSTTSSYDECQEAANALATEWINNSDFLAQLTEQHKEYYETQLKAMGIENYEEIIAYARELNSAKEALSQASFDLATATSEEIQALIADGEYTELAEQQIWALILAKQTEEGLTLNTSADCQNLLNLAKNAGVTGDAITLLTRLMNIYNNIANGVYGNNYHAIEDAKKQAEDLKNRINRILANGTNDTVKVSPKIEMSPSSKSSASSAGKATGEDAGKSAGEAFTDALDKELAALDKNLESGYINFNDYIQARLALIEDYYNQGKLSADEYYSYLEKHYDTQLSYMDKAVNAVTRRIDAELDALKQQKEDVENIYKVQIESLEEEKNLLEEANKERQRQKDLQKSLYDLERARNQRTRLVYSEDKGMHYVADDQSIRDAQENVDNAGYDIRIAEIDKSISKLEEARDKETNAIDEMISNLESYRDAWNDATSAYEEEQENLIAAQILGADWETDILKGRLDVLDAFKNQYIGIQQAMAAAAWESANEQVKAAKEAEKGASGSPSKAPNISGSNGKPSEDDNPQTPKTSGGGGGGLHSLGLGGNKLVYTNLQAYASGTNNAKKGLNLVGEGGPEAYFDNHGHVAIVTKPTLIPMEGGEVVKNERDTKKLLDPDNLTPVDTASVITPIQPGSFMWDLQEKFNAYISKMGKDVSSVMAPVDSIQKNMARTINGISPANNITNTGIHQVTIGDIHVTCPGVTSQEVARQVGVELNRQFSGFSLVALQESKK